MVDEIMSQTIEESMPIRPQVNSDFMKWIITGEDISEHVEVELTGKKFYNGKQMIVNPHKIPLINDKGINSLKILITGLVGKGAVASNLDDTEIERIADDLWRDVTDKIYCHYDDWDIDETNASTIRKIIVDNVFFGLKRAKEGRELEIWGKSVKRTEAYNPQQRKSGGFMSFLGLK